MKDLIERQTVIDAIEKNAYRHTYLDQIIDIIKGLPSAQPDLSGYSDRLWRAAYERGKAEAQPDIIHCGECKYYHDSDGCFFSTATTGADGFCHWAAKME